MLRLDRRWYQGNTVCEGNYILCRYFVSPSLRYTCPFHLLAIVDIIAIDV